MAENIPLAEFDIDVSAVVKNLTQLRQQIDALKEAQREAKKQGDTNNDQYTANEAALKALTQEYRNNQNSLNAVIQTRALNAKSTAEAIDREELLNHALNTEAVTISSLRAQNKLLNQLRNETNLETAEGRAELERLNKQLDDNNDKIKANVDSLSQQKINVGNYTDSINEAVSGMNPFNQSITVFISNIQEAGGVTKFFGQGIRAVTTAIKGMTVATLSFLATPIGAVIGAIGLALGLVVTALTSTQEGMDKVTAVTRPLTAVMEVLLGIVQDLGLALIDAFSDPLTTLEKLYDFVEKRVTRQFEALKDIVQGLFTLDFDQMQKGFDDLGAMATETWGAIGEAVGAVTDKVAEGVRLGEELDRLSKEYEETQIRNATLIPMLNSQLREQNKIAEDTTKSTAEREEAARRTLELSKQINAAKKDELALELQIAENEAARNDTTRADQLEIEKIKGRIHDADAQSAELETTQQNKLNTIRKDALTQQEKAVDEQIKKQQELLALFEAEQGERARTLAEEIELAEQVSERKKEILQAELDANKISEEAYRTEILQLDQDLARQRAELAADNAMREVEAQRQAIALRRENEGFLSAELAKLKQDENNALLEQEKELARLRLEQGLINQQEFDDAVRELKEANRIANQEIDNEREAVAREEELELQAIRFENELARMQEQGATAFEMEQERINQQRQIQRQQADQDLADGLISEQLYTARVAQINKQAADAELANEKALAEQKLAITQNTLGAISSLIGKESAAGKAVAIAQSLINTYQGITAALAAPFPLSIPAVATAAATGFKAVKDIMSTDPMGGGEGISADLSATSKPQSVAGSVAASGNAVVQQQIENATNQAGLTDSVSQAVKQGAREGTQQGSQEGITNLSDNKAIQKSSTI